MKDIEFKIYVEIKYCWLFIKFVLIKCLKKKSFSYLVIDESLNYCVIKY